MVVQKSHLRGSFAATGAGGHAWLDHVSAHADAKWMKKLQKDLPAYQAYIDSVRDTYQACDQKLEYTKSDKQLQGAAQESVTQRIINERNLQLLEIDSAASQPPDHEVLAQKRRLASVHQG